MQVFGKEGLAALSAWCARIYKKQDLVPREMAHRECCDLNLVSVSCISFCWFELTINMRTLT